MEAYGTGIGWSLNLSSVCHRPAATATPARFHDPVTGYRRTERTGGVMPRAWTDENRAPRGIMRDQLYNEAEQRNIEGRSGMSTAQLAHALGRA